MRDAKGHEVGVPPACVGELNMDPVEINAGQWYLRALRADNRIDDRPALADLGVTDPDYVARCTAQWSSDTSYSWAVCEPTTGELLAEVTLDLETGRSPPEHAPAKPRPRARPLSPCGDSLQCSTGFLRNAPRSLSAPSGRSTVRRRLSSQPPGTTLIDVGGG